jgi:hypothetical protein
MKTATAFLTLFFSSASALVDSSISSASKNDRSRTTSSTPEDFPGVVRAPIRRIRQRVIPQELPGVVPPIGFFDPLGFTSGIDENSMRRYREAELIHGRVAMLATVGFLAGETVDGSSLLLNAQESTTLFYSEISSPYWVVLSFLAAISEIRRAQIGWVRPLGGAAIDEQGLLLRFTEYHPGDIGFDPLGLKPRDESDLKIVQTKELQNGRLAMLAVTGFVAQELVLGKSIVEQL